MENNPFFSSNLVSKKTVFIPKDTIAYFTISESNNQYIFFNKDRLLLMYHLVRFGYFDRETINNIYFTITRKKSLTKQWLQNIIGNSRYPISASDSKLNGKTKIYYINSKFVRWLLTELLDHQDIMASISLTEREDSMHSIATNGLYGGKPKSINKHDYTIRVLTSKYAREVVEKIPHIDTETLNIQYSFPVNREISTLLPDSALFINNKVYYFEYDNGTEPQWKLLSKILRYISNTHFEDTNVYFIFNVAHKKRDLYMSERIFGFLNNIETNEYENKTIVESLASNNVNVFGLPEFQSITPVTESILSNMSIKKKQMTVELLNSSRGLPFEIESIKSANDNSIFDYYVTYQNEYFLTSKMPIVFIDYGKAGNAHLLARLKSIYQSDYDHICLIYSESITTQFQILKDDFFIAVYLS